MSQYTVIQDIEAEDKFVGPLTLKQFIFAGIATVLLYLSFLLITKGVWPLTLVLIPPALVALFLAWPWGRDQPTEIWLLAKIRFALKPHRRIWDQTGLQELVTITVPKHIEHQLTNGLDATQVQSRLQTLAQTIDTRGWAVKGVSNNLNAPTDRLIDPATLPIGQRANGFNDDIDDILDVNTSPLARQMEQLVQQNDQQHREAIMDRMNRLRQAATPTDNNDALATDEILPIPEPTAAPRTAMPFTPTNNASTVSQSIPTITPTAPQNTPVAPSPAAPKPAIIELARNDDLSVATIARQAQKSEHLGDNEVVISLR